MRSRIINIENILKTGKINIYKPKNFPKALTNLPTINRNYIVKRNKDIEAVIYRLNKAKKVVLVNGIGGIGKTTLAKILLDDHKTIFKHIVWINVTNGVKNAFIHQSLMQNLGIDIEKLLTITADNDILFELVINRLRQISGNNLLVIDNVAGDIHQKQTKDYINLSENWNVLVTSRQKIEGFDSYELGVLPQKDAIELFKLHYKEAQNTTEFNAIIVKILEAVDYHTLAIEIIARIAHQQGWSLGYTIEKLATNGLDFQERTNIKLNYSDKKPVRDVFSFILAAFKVTNITDKAKWILKQFAVLPSLPIHFENNDGENIQSFLNISKTPFIRDNFTDTISKLGDNGWLYWESEQDRFQMHRVVQEVLRKQLQPRFEDCYIMLEYFYEQFDLKTGYNPILLKRWSVYISEILKHIKADEPIIVKLLTGLGYLTTDFADYKTALQYQKDAIQSAQNLKDNYLTAVVLSNTSIIHRQLDNLTKAEQQLKEALKLYQNEEDLIRVTWKANLGIIYRHLGNYIKAKDLLETALESDIAVHGKRHPRTSLRQSVLSNVYLNLGEYNRAVTLANESLQTDLKLLGKKHPKIAVRQSNLANAYLRLRQYEKARVLLEGAVQLTEELLGENHTELATFLNGLASAYNGLGQYKRAITTLNKAIRIFINTFGVTNRKTIQVKNTLAQTYIRNSQVEQALNIAKDNIDTAKEMQVEKTEFYGLLLHTLGCSLVLSDMIQDVEQSKKKFEEAYQIFRRHLGDKHPMTKNTWEWIWKANDRLDALMFPMLRKFDDFWNKNSEH